MVLNDNLVHLVQQKASALGLCFHACSSVIYYVAVNTMKGRVGIICRGYHAGNFKTVLLIM